MIAQNFNEWVLNNFMLVVNRYLFKIISLKYLRYSHFHLQQYFFHQSIIFLIYFAPFMATVVANYVGHKQ